MRRTRAVAALCTLVVVLLLAVAMQAAAELPGSELTNSGGDLRTGWYPNEPSITPELVSGGTFGRLWTTPVEGQVYAQPLLSGGTLFVGTEDNDLYGLNPATGAVEWSKSLGEPWNPGEISCADLAPKVGVTATPVIDAETDVAYLTYKTYRERESEPEWFMDAVSVATGAQEPGFPVLLNGTPRTLPGRNSTRGPSCSVRGCCCWKASCMPPLAPIATPPRGRAGCSAYRPQEKPGRAGSRTRPATAPASGSRARGSPPTARARSC
jgi:hypothetical protein